MNMIEKVARAIYEADDVWSEAFPWPTMGSNEQSADNYRRIARAAIEAMREPTEEMRRAADHARNDALRHDENDQIGALNAAIDASLCAALSEEKAE